MHISLFLFHQALRFNDLSIEECAHYLHAEIAVPDTMIGIQFG